MTGKTDYTEIYANAIYNNAGPLTCNFPIKYFTNSAYRITYNIWLIGTTGGTANIILENNVNSETVCQGNVPNGGATLFTLKLRHLPSNEVEIECGTIKTTMTDFTKITYSYVGGGASPAIAMYTAKMSTTDTTNMSMEGTQDCDSITNPCLPRYTCYGGNCLKCDQSCLYCDVPNNSAGCIKMCAPHSTLPTPSIGQCPMNYVDISMFGTEANDVTQFSVNGIPPSRTNRLTIGLWIFFSKDFPTPTHKMNIKVADYLTMTFTSGTPLSLSCDYSYIGAGLGPLPGLEKGRWIYVKCGYTLDPKENAKHFIEISSDGITNSDENAVNRNDNDNDISKRNDFFRKFYREGDTISITFDNIPVRSNIYIRNLYLFREYVPSNYFDIKYYAIEKFIYSTNDIPELLFALPFDNLVKEGYSYKTNAFSYETAQKTYSVELAPVDDIDLTPPKIFKRLNLLEQPNVKYSSNDLYEKTALTSQAANYLYLFDDEKPFECKRGYFLRLDSSTCEQNCPTTFSMSPGISNDKGICNYQCLGKEVCQSNNGELTDLKTNFACNNVNFRMFYTCHPISQKEELMFYYTTTYNPGKIILDYSSYNLYSYFIEFWIIYEGGGPQTYFFYSNAVRLKKNNNNEFVAETTFGGENPIDRLIQDKWNRIIINVYYDEKGTNVDTIAKVSVNAGIEKPVGSTRNKVKLMKIYFCDNDPSCEGLLFNWGSGIYKNLRIWNGNLAHPEVAYRYLEYPGSFTRLVSTIGYYPLYGEFINKNQLVQMDSLGNLSTVYYIAEDFNPFAFQRWNYKLDPDTATCNNNCLRCFLDDIGKEYCYKCADGFYLSKWNCVAVKNIFTKIPTGQNINVDLYYNIQKGITISMWMKIFGFSTSNQDVMYFSDNLKIKYVDDITSDSYGLNLMTYRGASDSALSTSKYFRDLFGKWALVSVSYYSNTNTKTYFPPLLRFEINKENFPLVSTFNADITFNQLFFNQDMYALVYQLTVYDKYMVGLYYYYAYYYATNNLGAPINTAFFSCSAPHNCESSDAPQANILTCDSKCKNKCYKDNNDKACACDYTTPENYMFLGTQSEHYCYLYDYNNFARANVDFCRDFQGSKTGKATMHFWIYAHSFIDLQFEGIIFKWAYTLTMKIQKNFDGNGYEYECKVDTPGVSHKMGFEMNKWNFLQCAIDYPEQEFYMNTFDTDYEYRIAVNTPPPEMSSTSAVLSYEDLTTVDWGVLFFRFIRVWNDAFESGSYLSKVQIKSPSKFNGLIYQWEPIFRTSTKTTNGYSVRSIGGSCNMEIKKPIEIGSNIIPEEDYSVLDDFCSENGEYYDKKTSGCVKFTDIAKIQGDMTFSPIDVSYNHNYGIAFWIMLADEKELNREGFNVIWENHMQISLFYDATGLTAYCFPQNYPPYSDILNTSTKTFAQKKSEILNGVQFNPPYSNGKWQWFQCSLSYYNRYFYFNEATETLKAETLYLNSINDAPLGYFFHNDQSTKSQLILHYDKTTKIFMRSLYLFKDYLPYNYNFRYMDLTKINEKTFPPLTFVLNFAQYTLNGSTLTLKYRRFNNANQLLTGTKDFTILDPNKLELSSNFIFLPLCNPEDHEKYNKDTNLCEEISNCDLNGLNAIYCMDENTPLLCKDNYYLNLNQDGTIVCSGACPSGRLRSPGTANGQGICSAECISSEFLQTCPNTAASILSYQNSFACKSVYPRINYQCFDAYNSENKGALFYSRCNNPPNIYHSFSTNSFTTQYISKGYSIEFWFMIDHVICPTNTLTSGEYYYFYASPHAISWNTTKKYYYKYIPDNNYDQDITSLIAEYEWNKIVIMTDMTDPANQVITVYVNFHKEPIIIKGIVSVLSLKNIAFCTRKGLPACLETNENIQWGSAYYNNIRIWDIDAATIQVIEGYQSGMFSETLKALYLFYPLTIEKLDNNKMVNIITTYGFSEDIIHSIKSTDNIYSKDNILLYNYSSKFDWGLQNLGKYLTLNSGSLTQADCDIACERCFENDPKRCYQCKKGYVLIYQECKLITNYYLKTPSRSTKSNIPFVTTTDTSDVTKLTSFTFTFWMKFFGVEASSTSSQPVILSLSSSTYLAYDTSTRYLLFQQNNRVAFQDTNFENYIGQWIPISIANYISGAQNDIYPNMLTFSVDRIDIAFASGYTIPAQGVTVTQLNLGYEVVALFHDFRIYDKFYQGAYGRIMAPTDISDQNLFYHKALSGQSESTCVIPSSDLTTAVDIVCVPDYSVYFDKVYQCNSNETFFEPIDDILSPAPAKCVNCDKECRTECFKETDQTCTCDTEEGFYWLRRTKDTAKQTYCEKIPYLDFSNLYDITMTDVPITKSMEYSMELWVFVYSYNTDTNNFKDIHIEWSKHNKIYIYNENQSLRVKCFPIFDGDNTAKYEDNKVASIAFYQWNYIRCGTNLLTKNYYLGTIQTALTTSEDYIDYSTLDTTWFKIYRSSSAYTNFGFIFLRDIKLWQEYNYNFIDTQYITLNKKFKEVDPKTLKDVIETLTPEEIKTKFPGLVQYYRNLYKEIDSELVMIEEVKQVTTKVYRKIDYVGYNVVDPNNKGLISDLILCPLGQIYNSVSRQCVEKKSTVCEYVANTLGPCITCVNNQVYLHQIDGLCYNECPPYYFENDVMNQCRPCHDTCYRCTDRFYNNCTECTGSLYWNFKENTCIPNCEAVGLTKSLTRPNICVEFDADASLVNVDALTPIDINTFTYIEATVIGATSTGYTTLWKLDVDETNRINRELGFTDDLSAGASPFTGDLTDLNTPLDNTFFKLEHKYVFVLDIIKENMGESITITKSWTLTMNAPPKNGYIKIIPPYGLLSTTTYVITTYDWEDEDTVQENLEYWFYYIEANTNTKIDLSTAWTTNNEVYSNFTVRFYQLESSDINVYVKVRDQYHAESEATAKMTVVNQIGSSLYDLTVVTSNYDLNPGIPDLKYLSRSEFLKSAGINPYRDVQPDQYYITYENSLDGSIVTKVDPNCVDVYCNGNGQCGLIDVTIACYCDLGFLGNNCNLDKNGYSKLAYYYQEMFDRLMDVMEASNSINQIQFNSMYNLFFAAQTFIQDTTFFTVNLQKFLTFLTTTGNALILTQVDKLMDFYDFYYRYYYIKLTQAKLSNKISTSPTSPEVNFTLLISQQKDYETAYGNFIGYMTTVTEYLIKNYNKDYVYTTPRINYTLIKIDETFNETEFFETFPSSYSPYINFMSCLTDKHPSFSYWFLFIHYFQYPFSYDSLLYPNVTSPYITVALFDSNGKEVTLEECTSEPIKLYLPFNSYLWLSYINTQKSLFDPANYKLPNDPIFKDPIYIADNGYISEDTVQDRIDKYYRHYNFSGLYYIKSSNSFSTSGITYETYTTDKNYIVFNSQHLASFTSMLIPNIVEFEVDGRFFYITKYMIFKYWPNYKSNYAFIMISIFLGLFLFACLFYWLYDYSFFNQKSLLEFLKREIVKVHMPYVAQSKQNINELIPRVTPTVEKKKEIKHMFDNVKFDDDSKSNEEDSNRDEENADNILQLNDNGTGNDGGYNSNNNSDFNSNKGDDEDITEKGKEIVPITKYTDTVDNLSTVMNKYATTTTGGNRKKNNYFLDNDKTKPNLISLQLFHNSAPAMPSGDLPEDLGNEDEDKARSLEAYANLKIPTTAFISWNILHKHPLINPILHISLFNPRWKKFFILVTQLYVQMLIISVMLTDDETITSKNIAGMLKVAVISALGANVLMYLMVFFFITSTYQRRRLFHFVINGGQLVVIKAFEKIMRSNAIWTTIGMIICLIFWIGNFYISVAFTAVWSVQKDAWLITFIISMIFDLIIFELLIEVIIGAFYSFRAKRECLRGFGEWLNRVRCYRTLWP